MCWMARNGQIHNRLSFVLMEPIFGHCQLINLSLMKIFLDGLSTHLCLPKEGSLFTIMHGLPCELLDGVAISTYPQSVEFGTNCHKLLIFFLKILIFLSPPFFLRVLSSYLPPSPFLFSICCVWSILGWEI